jgi:hypothetical protein
VNAKTERFWKEAVDLILRYHPEIRLERLTKTGETSVRIADLQDEIRNRELPNTKQEC